MSVRAHSTPMYVLFWADARGTTAGRPGRRLRAPGRCPCCCFQGSLYTCPVAAVQSLRRIWLFCTPCLPGSSVPGISQTRTLEWVAIPFSRRSSWPRHRTCVSCIGRQILYRWATGEALMCITVGKLSKKQDSHSLSLHCEPNDLSTCHIESFQKSLLCCLVTKSYLPLCSPVDCSPRLLCPWDFPGKNTGVSCHFLLQGIFPTQGLKPHLLFGRCANDQHVDTWWTMATDARLGPEFVCFKTYGFNSLT